MEVNLPAGTYVMAVSGGVDSIALLHALSRRTDLRIIAAHFDHGIRADSTEDRKLVEQRSKDYKMMFTYEEGKLGKGASEAEAREVRYEFLHRVRVAHGAMAIITAHHQDDVLETIILNLLRGTSHRGLYSLKTTETIKRPLLEIPKKELLRYAKKEHLQWNEDSTNADTTYLRNYVRVNILPRFAQEDRDVLLRVSQKAALSGSRLEYEAEQLLELGKRHTLDRHMLILLPHDASRELLAVWLRKQGKIELSRQLLERLVIAAKTGKNGSKIDVNKQLWLSISHTELALIPRER